jgi:ribonuclease VapC
VTSVLDASAFLAYLRGEPGGVVAAQAIEQQTAISLVNWAETLTLLVDLGATVTEATARVRRLGILGRRLRVVPLTRSDAEMARLRALTRHLGLSLGDRACLALGLRLGLPVVTADRDWAQLDFGVPIQVIRS